PTSGPRPTDVAKTTTTAGHTVDYIVRRELGVINRGVYEIQFLHRPGDPLPSPWARSAGVWNGRLVYRFGAGCRPGYRQAMLSDRCGAGAARGTGVRDRRVVLELVRERLQRPHLGRVDGDGEGAFHRGVRRAGPHDRLRRLGRGDAGPDDGAELSRPARRHHL